MALPRTPEEPSSATKGQQALGPSQGQGGGDVSTGQDWGPTQLLPGAGSNPYTPLICVHQAPTVCRPAPSLLMGPLVLLAVS